MTFERNLVLISTSKFSKTTSHKHVVRIQFVAFEKFKSAYLHQIAREIMLLLVNSLHEKCITKSQGRRNFVSARYFQFALVLQLCVLEARVQAPDWTNIQSLKITEENQDRLNQPPPG